VEAAKFAIMEFLKWDHVDEEEFAQDTRIVLTAADFSKELTTTVMWLIDHGIDIRCMRMKPYRMADGTVLLDVEQLIPLPEAASFQTQIGFKRQAERQNRNERQELRLKFWEGLLEHAKTKTDVDANSKPAQGNWISGGIGRASFALMYVVRKEDSQVELWIGLGPSQTARNKAAFKALEAQKAAIEADFGARLDWQELPESDGCRVRYVIEGGYKSPPEQWSAIQVTLAEKMVKLEKAMRGRVASLSI
jgi:hypothetical protein